MCFPVSFAKFSKPTLCIASAIGCFCAYRMQATLKTNIDVKNIIANNNANNIIEASIVSK